MPMLEEQTLQIKEEFEQLHEKIAQFERFMEEPKKKGE